MSQKIQCRSYRLGLILFRLHFPSWWHYDACQQMYYFCITYSITYCITPALSPRNLSSNINKLQSHLSSLQRTSTMYVLYVACLLFIVFSITSPKNPENKRKMLSLTTKSTVGVVGMAKEFSLFPIFANQLLGILLYTVWVNDVLSFTVSSSY